MPHIIGGNVKVAPISAGASAPALSGKCQFFPKSARAKARGEVLAHIIVGNVKVATLSEKNVKFFPKSARAKSAQCD